MSVSTRRQFLGALPAAVAAPGRRRPNVILIMTDDQGYGDFSCHGNPVISTPNLDRLHSQSVRLTNFHVSPTCSPTRSALLTGHYSNRTGVWHTIMGRSLLRADEVTAADVFAHNGYRTGMFGKWHLGDNYPLRPHHRGFHEALTFGGGGVGNTTDYWGNDYFDDTYRRNGKPEKFQGYCTDVWFREAMRFMEANRRQPFFCYLPTNAPHSPYLVDAKYCEPYRRKGLRSPVAEFYGMIANIDENVGRLVRRLDELGLADNTILVFLTDNGTAAGAAAFNAGMRGAKGSPYDGGHRVPFWVRWPAGGLGGGRDVSTLTAHVDVLPTLVELCGLRTPRELAFDGTSVAPLLRGGHRWPERTLVVDSQRLENCVKWRQCAVMTDRWRLVNGEELYDMRADPGQKTDIAARQPETVARLRAEYDKWWDSVSARFGEYTHIVLGSDGENPTWLAPHDLHGDPLWLQSAVDAGMPCGGFWAVEIARDGLYEFRLRRWPPELERRIAEPGTARPRPGAVPFDRVTGARLQVAGSDLTRPVPAGADEVRIRVPLRRGQTRLEASFTAGPDATCGVYYVGAERVG